MEYSQLFSLDKATREALLEKIPVLEQAKVEEQRKGTGEAIPAVSGVGMGVATIASINAMDDLLGLDSGESLPLPSSSGTKATADLLSDIFGGTSAAAISTTAPVKPKDVSCKE